MQPSIKIETVDLSVWFGNKQVVNSISMKIPQKSITALIGPSGCGKSTFLRALNRMHDLNPKAKVKGKVLLDGVNIYSDSIDLVELRRRVGMVFQRPNPFPKSIYENVAYGPRLMGKKKKSELDEIVEKSLKAAALWNEVKDRLHSSALDLSGGQQQRLCIARALAVQPEVLMMDEPCSALDPVSTFKIEELMVELKEKYTIVIVTHNMQQAARISDYTGFLYYGKLVEFDVTERIFSNPSNELTEKYISGRLG